jgi:hypothetical protein
MKSERRHELQTNVLADWLGKVLATLQPYSTYILGGCLVLLVAGLVAIIASGWESFWPNSRTARSGRSWAEFMATYSEAQREAMERGDSDLLYEFAENHPNSTAGLWARQAQADMDLQSGVSKIYNKADKNTADEAKDELGNAAEAYQTVMDSAKDSPMLRQRAMLGYAQANEFLSMLTEDADENQEYVDAARQNYEQLAETAADTTVGRLAAERLRLLNELAGAASSAGEDGSWYRWLAQQELPPPTPIGQGLPGGQGFPGGQGLPGDMGLGGGTPRVGSNTLPGGPSRRPLPPAPTLTTPFSLDNGDDAEPAEGSGSEETSESGKGSEAQKAPDAEDTSDDATSDSDQPSESKDTNGEAESASPEPEAADSGDQKQPPTEASGDDASGKADDDAGEETKQS